MPRRDGRGARPQESHLGFRPSALARFPARVAGIAATKAALGVALGQTLMRPSPPPSFPRIGSPTAHEGIGVGSDPFVAQEEPALFNAPRRAPAHPRAAPRLESDT